MKKFITLILAAASVLNINAQQDAPPQGINYQAVAIDNNGKETVGLDVSGFPVSEKEIRVRFSILNTSENGSLTYREQHSITTDSYGLFNVVIGQGILESSPNNFNQIDWGTGYHFLKVEIDITGGTNYKDMGTQQLWSVPYALHSKYASVAGNGINSVIDNGNGTISFTYVDGSTYTTPTLTGLTGAQGPAGTNGQNGASAYEIWLTQGNSGTEAAFLNSLLGAQGTQGIQGSIGAIGPQGIQGPIGVMGATGSPGSLDAWSLIGNAGTTPSSNFIGTTDSQDLVIKTDNTERMRITPSGDVGIGTNNPLSSLHLIGTLSSETSATNNIYRQVFDNSNLLRYTERLNINSSSTQIDIDPFSTDAIGDVNFRFFRHTNTVGSKFINFLRGNGTTQSSALIGVDGVNSYFQIHGGNFGIGTSSPLGRFHAYESTTNSSILLMNSGEIIMSRLGAPVLTVVNQTNFSSGDYYSIKFTRGDGSGSMSGISTRGDGLNGIASMGLNVGSGNNPHLNILSNGNVGIGTTQPLDKLHLTGGGVRIDGSYGIGFNSCPPSDTILNEGARIYWKEIPAFGPTKDYFVFEKTDANGPDPDGGFLFVNTGNDYVKSYSMMINGNGNVGIGTITPARTLHVNAVMRLEPIPAAPTLPAKGDMYFDSTLNKLRVYDGSVWQNCW